MTDDDRPKRLRMTPPFGSRDLAAPHEIEPETTGVYTRLKHLSAQHDVLAKRLVAVEADVGEVKTVVASIDGKLDGVAIAIDAFKIAVQTTNTHIRADIDVTRARAITDAEDQADARKTRRHLALKIASLFTSGGVIGIVVTAVLAKGC